MYNYFVRSFGGSWSEFISDSPENLNAAAQSFAHKFQQTGYLASSILLFGVVLFAVWFYYFHYNRYPGFHFRRKYWVITLVATVIAVGILTPLVLRFGVMKTSFPASAQYSAMAIINSIYSAILFFVLSVAVSKIPLLARHSNAPHTPF